jgi:hypothetical protein
MPLATRMIMPELVILSKLLRIDFTSPKFIKSLEENITPLPHFCILLIILSSIDCI